MAEKDGPDFEAFQALASDFMAHATQMAAASIHMQMLMLTEAREGMDQMLNAMAEKAEDENADPGDRPE